MTGLLLSFSVFFVCYGIICGVIGASSGTVSCGIPYVIPAAAISACCVSNRLSYPGVAKNMALC